MSDPSRPPGLDGLPPGLDPSSHQSKKTTISRNGYDASHSSITAGSGRGSGVPKSHQPNSQPNQPTVGRAKKKEAKQTSAAQQPASKPPKSSNLSSFGDNESPTSSVTTDSEGVSKKAASKPKAKATSGLASAPSKQWEVTQLPPEAQQVPCLICCEPIEFFAIGACNHTEVCGLCTIRRRQLYKEMDCCICKKTLDHVIVDRESRLKYSELYSNRKESQTLEASTITINDPAYFAYCKSLFEIRCPVCKDGKAFPSVPILKKHVENVHRQLYCELCLEHRKCLLHEQHLYQPEQLVNHIEKGDPSIQLKPHPSCEYCRTVFYSIEDLFRHCEEAHEKCFLCERENILYNYFRDYSHMDKHFTNKHFACRERDCLEKRFVVFASALDLQAHNVSAHLPQERVSARNARVVHLDFGGSSDTTHGARAPPSRPAQMPVFYPDRYRPPPPTASKDKDASFSLAGRIEEQKPVTTIVRPNSAPASNPAVNSGANLSVATRTKNLIANIKAYLNNEMKFNKFRTISADYRNSKISASSYYEQFVLTFGDDAQVYALFEEMVDLLPDPVKQAELRSLREQDQRRNLPSMASRIATSTYSNGTASSQSVGVNTRAVQAVNNFTTEDFPSLNGGTGAVAPANAFTTHYASLTTSGRPVASSEEAFPSLPSESRHGSAMQAPRGAWSSGSSSNAANHAGGGGGGKKKGKQGKQVLILY